jgi:CubicO group peptidase (beta-lactamase class C family)
MAHHNSGSQPLRPTYELSRDGRFDGVNPQVATLYRRSRACAVIGAATLAAMMATSHAVQADTPKQGQGHAALLPLVDELVLSVMENPATRIAGMTVAVSRNGKLLLNRGYGYADRTSTPWKLMTPSKRSNIGSVSKAVVTGPAGWKLMDERGINPSTRLLYGPTGVLGSSYWGHQDIGNRRYNPIVAMAIAPDNRVYTWYSDRTMSIGTSTNLTAHQGRRSYTIPLDREPSDIRAIDIAKNGRVYVWYDDRTLSIGTSRNLGAYEVPPMDANNKPTKLVSLPSGRGMSNILDIAIAKSNDHVYVWYDDGTVSAGTSTDFDAYRAPYNYTTSGPVGMRYLIRGVGISSTDRVYVWFSNGATTNGTTNYVSLTNGGSYTVPGVPDAPNWVADWYGKMTVQHLLSHQSGFSHSGDLAGAAKWAGVPQANVTYQQLHMYMLMTKKLGFAPGTKSSYSNHGFGLWTLMVPAITGGTSYKSYAVNNYLKPLGLHTKVKDRTETPDSDMSRGYGYANGSFVARPYSGDPQGLAAGGWTASAESMLRITNHLITTHGAGDVDLMGWGREERGKLEHSGSTGGGYAYVAIFPPGYTSVSGVNLSNVHVALASNTEMSSAGAAQLDYLATYIALAVPQALVPNSYDLW